MHLFYDFFFIIGILLLFIYTIFLYKSSLKSLPHKILLLLFVILLLVLLDSYSLLHKIKLLSLITFVPASVSKVLIGTLLFLYIKSIFYDDKIILRKYWQVFIPFILFLLFYSIPTGVALWSQTYFLGYLKILSDYNHLVRIFSDLVFFTFLILCLLSFRKLKHALKCNYSDISLNNFIWVRYLLVAGVVIIFIDFVFALLSGVVIFQVRTQNIVMVLLVVSVVYAAYFGLYQSKVLVPYFLLEEGFTTKTHTKPLESIAQKQFADLEQKLNQVFLHEKPYLDPELTLTKLANILSISDKKLSALLNEYMLISFYDFVNSFRISAFKELVKQKNYGHYTIEGMAFECGFKSRATFYRVFKSKMNMSPSEYITPKS